MGRHRHQILDIIDISILRSPLKISLVGWERSVVLAEAPGKVVWRERRAPFSKFSNQCFPFVVVCNLRSFSEMYIKQVVIDGFKSYAQRTTVSGFDPQFNAITGLNGSGKSNILDSICFLLGISNLSQVSLNFRLY